jgi:uncharacterized protein YjbI with pentapeptide repeats
MVGLSWEVSAFSEKDLEKLKATGECIDCDLSGADLSWLDLNGANLAGSNLTGANFYASDLTDANLTNIQIDEKALSTLMSATLKNELIEKQEEAKRLEEEKKKEEAAEKILQMLREEEEKIAQVIATKECRKCDLVGVDLRGANLSEANLSEANLNSADLRLADLRLADLTEVNLSEANLNSANLSEANLSEANLNSADLRLADLRLADLTGANLSRANLNSADLRLADLTGANLLLAQLYKTDLSFADLSGATVLRVELSGANLTGAIVPWSDPKDIETYEDAKIDFKNELAKEKRKREEEAERLVEEMQKEEEAKRLAEEKRKEKERLAEEKRKEKERLAEEKRKEKERLRKEQIALNPGFRDLKPGLTVDEIRLMKACFPALSSVNSSTCYDMDNMKFEGEFRSGILQVLRLDMGPVVQSSQTFFGRISDHIGDGDIVLSMRKALSKYEMDYQFSERDRQLFNEQEKDKLYIVYEKGQVALLLTRVEKSTYNIDNHLFVEYRDPETAKRFLENNKPKKAKSSDF